MTTLTLYDGPLLPAWDSLYAGIVRNPTISVLAIIRASILQVLYPPICTGLIERAGANDVEHLLKLQWLAVQSTGWGTTIYAESTLQKYSTLFGAQTGQGAFVRTAADSLMAIGTILTSMVEVCDFFHTHRLSPADRELFYKQSAWFMHAYGVPPSTWPVSYDALEQHVAQASRNIKPSQYSQGLLGQLMGAKILEYPVTKVASAVAITLPRAHRRIVGVNLEGAELAYSLFELHWRALAVRTRKDEL